MVLISNVFLKNLCVQVLARDEVSVQLKVENTRKA